MPTTPPSIFILGITQRSGTNYLHDLLALHPDCRPGGVIFEDFLIHYSDPLARYVSTIYDHWSPEWNVLEKIGPEEVLFECLGNGLLEFLARQWKSASTELNPRQRLLSKTPSVVNLRHFFRFFPHAHLLIVVRDGRAIAESAHRSFNTAYERSFQELAAGAREILRFKRVTNQETHPFSIVRYEDLYPDPEPRLRELFPFLGLDPQTFDFDKARNLPVRGSSDVKQTEGQLHWKPVEKKADFNPLNRFAHWPPALHERFAWVVGPYLAELGYEPAQVTVPGFLKKLRHRWLDWRWKE